jgi:aspartate/methionine/tyrosine aminotransferase
MEGAEYVYQLDEEANWGITEKELQAAYDNAVKGNCNPRCLVIINPSNPCGSVQTKDQLLSALRWAHKNHLVVIADEVYQDNIYNPDQFPFISCYKLLRECESHGELLGLELISVHSASKSCFGECGRRGGYWHCRNLNEEVLDQILDCYSLTCANADGMIAMDVVVNHPEPGEESYPQFKKEYEEIFESLKRKAVMNAQSMNTWEGMSCVTPTGAMYVYPRIEIGEKGIAEAKKLGITPDELYCRDLMHEVGVVTLPGNMFGQKEGTYHLRTTILLDEEVNQQLLQKWEVFHKQWYNKYK